MTEAKLKALLGSHFGKIQDCIASRLKDGLAPTNEDVIRISANFCNNKGEVTKVLNEMVKSDPTKKMLVKFLTKDIVIEKEESKVHNIIPNIPPLAESSIIANSLHEASVMEIKEVTIEVTIVSHAEWLTEEINGVLKKITKAGACKAFKEAILHFKQKVKEGVISQENFLNLSEIQVNDGNEKGQNVLIDGLFIYTLLPDQLKIQFSQPPDTILSSKVIEVTDVKLEKKHSPAKSEGDQKQFLLAGKFIKFLLHFSGSNFIHITRSNIKNAVDEAQKEFIGIDRLCHEIRKHLNKFASESFSLPKGFLFYGPPGTGKSAIIKYIMDRLPFEYICEPLAAGDFNKGIVGDSERMINQLARRAKAVPWQLCCLLIDEIDALAPNRMSSSTSSHSINTLSVLLSVLDGGKMTPNFKIFATTNKFEQMDEAFCRRLDVKIFVGKPDFDARRKWAVEVAKKIRNEPARRTVESKITPKIDTIVKMTLNFSCDALKKMFAKLYDDMIYEKSAADELDKLIRTTVEDVCVAERIQFGPFELPNLEKGLIEIERDPKYSDIREMWGLTTKLNESGEGTTRRIFIDLNELSRFQIQVEKKSGEDMTREQKDILSLIEENEMLLEEKMGILKAHFPLSSVPSYDPRLVDTIDGNQSKFDEAFLSIKKARDGKTEVGVYGVKGGISSVESEVYPILITFAQKNQLATVNLIDSHFLLRKEASEDAAAEMQITYAMYEAKKQSSGMVIYNLDSIAGLSKEYSGLKEDVKVNTESMETGEGFGGPSLHYTKTRGRAFQQALNEFCSAKDLTGNSNIWVVAISAHGLLTQQFKERVNWPQTVTELNHKKDLEDKKKLVKCAKCHLSYAQGENDPNGCGEHLRDELYLVSEHEKIRRDLDKAGKSYSGRDIYKALTIFSFTGAMAEIKAGTTPAQEFKWLCCGKGLYEKGEIPCPHSQN